MEHGFYHPGRGYWQTVSEPPQHILDGYPEGTIEVPLKPGPDYEWQDGEWVYVEPVHDIEAERAAMSLTFPQLLIGLVAEGWITEAEGEAWLVGTIPAPALAVINSLPQEQRFAAKARAIRRSVVLRTDPLVIALAQAQAEEKTPEDMDAFFRAYAAV